MKIRVLIDADAVAKAAAEFIAARVRAAVRSQGRCVLGVSGGQTPQQMLRALAVQDAPWDRLHVVQVDERVAPLGHPDRNLTHLRESLLNHCPLEEGHFHAMPVDSPDLDAAAAGFAQKLLEIAGSPPVLDLVHLGLGPDGHTASLVPGDPVLDVTDAPVALTGEYRGRRRMTLTYPTLNRSRQILWVVCGMEKAGVFAKLRAGDESIPAGRVSRRQAVIIADGAAAGLPGPVEVSEELS